MIYIKSIVVISPNNNKFLVISTYIKKDLFNILPLTKIYIYIYKHNIKIKKKIKYKHNKNLSTTIIQNLLIRPTQKKTQNKSYL